MNHRKVRSHGYIPFSWEEKPGIPKFMNHNKSSSDMVGLMGLNNLCELMPPPPCTTRKGCRWQDDPFLSALKSCSKGGDWEKNLNKTSFFSCKHSCNVVNDNLVKFSKLPPIPKQRYYAKSFVRNFNWSDACMCMDAYSDCRCHVSWVCYVN